MKRFFVVVACFVLAPLSAAAAPDWRMDFGFSLFDLSFRLGAEVAITDEFSIRAEAGPSLFSFEGSFVLKTGLEAIWYFARNESGELGISVGVPDFLLVFLDPLAYRFSPGLGLVGTWFPNSMLTLGCRAGLGYPYYKDENKAEWGNSLFYGFWPEVEFRLGYRLPN